MLSNKLMKMIINIKFNYNSTSNQISLDSITKENVGYYHIVSNSNHVCWFDKEMNYLFRNANYNNLIIKLLIFY